VLLCRAPCQLQYDGQLNNLQHIIAVARGYSYGTKLDQLDFQRAAVVDSDNMLIKQILNGRLEAGIMSLKMVRPDHNDLAGYCRVSLALILCRALSPDATAGLGY